MKTCSKCNISKSTNDFPIVFGRKRKDGTRKQRYNSQCRECRYSICKEWFDKIFNIAKIIGSIKDSEEEEQENNEEPINKFKKNDCT
jgi:hypothetical protein